MVVRVAPTMRLDVYEAPNAHQARGPFVARYFIAPTDHGIAPLIFALVATGDRVEVRLLGAADGEGPFEDIPHWRTGKLRK